MDGRGCVDGATAVLGGISLDGTESLYHSKVRIKGFSMQTEGKASHRSLHAS